MKTSLLEKMPKLPKIPVKQYFFTAKQLFHTSVEEGTLTHILTAWRYRSTVNKPANYALFYRLCNEWNEMRNSLDLCGSFIYCLCNYKPICSSDCYLYTGENVGWTATNAMRGKLAEHCLQLEMSFHKSRTSGEMIERIDGDINSLAHFFSSFVILLLSNLVLLLGVLVLLYREVRRYGLALSLFVIIALRSSNGFAILPYHFGQKCGKSAPTFSDYLGEHLAGTEDTRANGATILRHESLLQHAKKWLPVRRKASIAGGKCG